MDTVARVGFGGIVLNDIAVRIQQENAIAVVEVGGVVLNGIVVRVFYRNATQAGIEAVLPTSRYSSSRSRPSWRPWTENGLASIAAAASRTLPCGGV